MRRITLTILAVFLTTTFAMAQVQFGVRAGLNTASISDGDSFGGDFGGDNNLADQGEENWRTGLVAGVVGNFVITENFSVLSELVWSQRGEEFERNFDNTESKIRLNYWSVPVLGKFGFGETLRGYLTLGPTFSYLSGGSVEVNNREFDIEFVNGPQEFDPNNAQDIQVNDDKVNRFEFGGAIGAGVQLNTGAGDFLIDLRYTTGFSDLIEDNEGTFNVRQQNADGFRNRVVSVSLIYLVPTIQK